MSATEVITHEDLLRAIEEIQNSKAGNEPVGYTCQELADIWGYGKEHAGRKIRQLAKEGYLECSGKRQTVNVAGNTSWVPVYVFKKTAPHAKKHRRRR